MVSASHNPSSYNGIKIKTSQGCSAPESVTKQVEDSLSKSFSVRDGGSLTETNITEGYLSGF